MLHLLRKFVTKNKNFKTIHPKQCDYLFRSEIHTLLDTEDTVKHRGHRGINFFMPEIFKVTQNVVKQDTISECSVSLWPLCPYFFHFFWANKVIIKKMNTNFTNDTRIVTNSTVFMRKIWGVNGFHISHSYWKDPYFDVKKFFLLSR